MLSKSRLTGSVTGRTSFSQKTWHMDVVETSIVLLNVSSI